MNRTTEELFILRIAKDFPLFYECCRTKALNASGGFSSPEIHKHFIIFAGKESLYPHAKNVKELKKCSRRTVKRHIRNLKYHIYNNRDLILFHEL